jgi:hypothetical protein
VAFTFLSSSSFPPLVHRRLPLCSSPPLHPRRPPSSPPPLLLRSSQSTLPASYPLDVIVSSPFCKSSRRCLHPNSQPSSLLTVSRPKGAKKSSSSEPRIVVVLRKRSALRRLEEEESSFGISIWCLIFFFFFFNFLFPRPPERALSGFSPSTPDVVVTPPRLCILWPLHSTGTE